MFGFSKKKKHKAVIANLIATVMGVGTLILAIVIVAISLGYLGDINEDYLGNNSNATSAINTGFSLVSLVQGLSILLVAVSLLWMLLGGMIGAGGGGGGRGRRR